MVCPRCIKVVSEELEALGYIVQKVELGEASIATNKTKINIDKIKEALEKNGFELLDDRHGKVIEKMKTIIIETIRFNNNESLEEVNFSKLLSNNLNLSYQHLSTLFSSLEGITLEKYIINQKIEVVKEYLIYDELTLSEISFRLGYSSVQHLSSQFKKVTGFTPSKFKSLKIKPRKPIDQLTGR
jgi:AraC-like DNA-binding protein